MIVIIGSASKDYLFCLRVRSVEQLSVKKLSHHAKSEIAWAKPFIVLTDLRYVLEFRHFTSLEQKILHHACFLGPTTNTW